MEGTHVPKDTIRNYLAWYHYLGKDHLENNDYNENHGSEAPDDNSDDEGHGWWHAWKLKF